MRKFPLLVAALGVVLVVASFPPGESPRAARADEPATLPAGVKRVGKKFFSTIDGEEMAYVPSGAFILGNTSQFIEDPEDFPEHQESTGPFFIDIHEVTNGRYAKFLAAIALSDSAHSTCPPDEPRDKDHRPLDWGTKTYAEISPGDDYPVCGVDWYDARAYAAWAGKRLPTDIEWEKAARGTDGREFPWGDEQPAETGITGRASPCPDGSYRANWNTDKDGFLYAAPVGRFPKGASPYGVLDIAGNVWEWTSSPFWIYPGQEPENLNLVDHPESRWNKIRSFRGGSFDFHTQDIQTTHRHWAPPEKRMRDVGIRCVVSAP
jgi:formylglycine-generating enzyme required for sulfatase activity